jgi:hypothetical protein
MGHTAKSLSAPVTFALPFKADIRLPETRLLKEPAADQSFFGVAYRRYL